MLAASDRLELAALTTVARDPARRAHLAARLLALAGRSDVPVHVGEGRPLLRDPARFGWFGHEEHPLAGEGPSARVDDEPAPAAIVRLTRECEGMELVAIGPMTNVARALALDPELPKRVSGLTVMGGHIRRVAIGDFECAPGIDYNLCSDPEASVAVLGAGFRTTLVTADVTLQVWIDRAGLDKLDRGGTLARSLADQVRTWEPVQRQLFTGLGGQVDPDNMAFLHDPLTVLALLDPEPLGFERLRIVPTVEDGVLRTLEVDPGVGIGAEMRVATTVDARAAADRIVTLLAKP